MKSFKYLHLFIFILAFSHSFSQNRVKVFAGANLGIFHMKLTGIENVSKGIDKSRFPVYRHVDTTSILGNLALNFGVDIPFYANEFYSIGTSISTSFGFQYGIIAAKDMNSLLLFFPEYLYFRNYSGDFDYSLLVGYQYSFQPLPHKVFNLGFEIFSSDDYSYRLYSSFLRDKFYRQYSNGKLEPMLKVGGFGVCVISKF